jgi:hypothetical protein
MRYGYFVLWVAGTLLLVLTASAIGREKKVKKSELPAAVQKAAQEQSEGATIRGYTTEVENGEQKYEVETTFHGHSRDVTFSPEGKVLEIEQQMLLADLPPEVRDGLRVKAGGGTITRIESLTKDGKLVAYEAQVSTGGKRSEIQIGPDGKTLAQEE